MPRFLKRLWFFLTRMDLAFLLILAVILLAAICSFFPQPSTLLISSPYDQTRWQKQPVCPNKPSPTL
jgi:hypothetical protein